MNATNTFQDGLIMDSHPLATPNNVLTNCLNGTLITYNGNELILQNDVGNSKIKTDGNYVCLKDGYVPIGLKEFGGILYIFSVNPKTDDCEIGTFPSPDYSKKSGNLIYKYLPLHNYVNGTYESFLNYSGNKESLISDFNTKNLNFDTSHPLQIDCLKSYDGSINLIFTDNKNIPRLINTRFSLYGDNLYERVDRSGDNDSNIYFNEDFEYSTSLHKIVNSIVKIKFDGILTGGNLLVGTYTFYFTLADSDDNESDFIGLSSLVTCHKGNLNDPFSIDGGIENENSYKQVGFTLSNIPRQFSRVHVYYSRNSSDASGNALTTYKKINKHFDILDNKISFIISGFEQTEDVDKTTINTNYLTIDATKTQSINLNILFYGNIKLKTRDYQNLLNFSRENIKSEYITNKVIGNVELDFSIDDRTIKTNLNDEVYESFGGYYNVNNIYNFVGYWPTELYRFGVVYIFDDYSLSPVFNMHGDFGPGGNDYGIFKFPENFDLSLTKPLGIKFSFTKELPPDVIGYFFVRLKRLQTILALGVRIGSDLGFSYLPLLYTEKMTGKDDSIYAENDDMKSYVYYPKYSIWSDTGGSDGNGGYEEQPAFFGQDVSAEGVLYKQAAIDAAEEKYKSFYGLDAEFDRNIAYVMSARDTDISPTNSEKSKDIGWFTECFINKTYESTSSTYKFSIFNIINNFPKENNTNIFSGIYPMETDKFSKTPLIRLGSSFIGHKQMLETVNQFGIKEENRNKPLYAKDSLEPDAMIVPEYDVNLQYYNLLFTGGKLLYKKVGKYQKSDVAGKYIFTNNFEVSKNNQPRNAFVIGVPENTPAVRTKNKIYSSVAGNPAEADKVKVPFANFRVIGDTRGKSGKNDIDGLEMKTDDVDITWACRGIWGPYVGIEEDSNNSNPEVYDVVNILIPNYLDLLNDSSKLIKTRSDDSSEYYPISERISVNDPNGVECFRGDCFICNFAHTMNRNFADPSFPINTDIADYNTWYKGYRTKYDTQNQVIKPSDIYTFKYRIFDKFDVLVHKDSLEYLNRSDVNAVALGHTFVTKIYSSINLCMRSTDGSNITERATFHEVRSFCPLKLINGEVPNKISDSYIHNGAYEKSLGELMFSLLEDVPALKTNYSNRIVYSDIAIKDAYINNFRTFRKTSYLDYTRLYGEIVKILNWYDSYILCVFEHAVAIIEVNERAITGTAESGFAYISTQKVISDKPKFVSTEYGSLWGDSVILTATGVYGIDTVAKKIWRYGESFEALSDLKILKFLKDNLDVTEWDNNSDITKLNVKTHYNEHKQDIMFTFFKKTDDDYLGWNICYNEITKKFTTFYSWIPSYSGNINNIFYSFDNEYSIGNLKQAKHNFLWLHNKENNWCNWYDEQHPFEFEFVVADNPQVHKIFNNLKIIANKTKPESFHFEVVGEVYDFKKDKKNMYYRQEHTKDVYNTNLILQKLDGITYDPNYKQLNINRNPKSAMFPLSVSRVNRRNKIYDSYLRMTSKSKDYLSMSGSEIVYDATTNDYNVATHIKAYPIDGYEWQVFVYDDDPNSKDLINYYKSHNIQVRHNPENECWEKKIEYGRRLGNCKYDEDIWEVQVPAINYAEKNETWTDEPPINIAMTPVPEDLMVKGELKVPSNIEVDYWGPMKQTRIRDKYIRIKVRYSGQDLAIISAIITQYKESYS